MKELMAFKADIDDALQGFFAGEKEEAKALDPFSCFLVEQLEEFTLRGGKRIRAGLLYYSYQCFSQENLKEIFNASMCLELVQSYLLIHDDIIDRDDIRRGGDTVHNFFLKYHKKHFDRKDPQHFGNSIAILVGDIASSMANKILGELQIDAEKKVAALLELNAIVKEVIFGEALDVLTELRDDLVEEDLLKVHRYKTSSYTISGPLRLGAKLAGADENALAVLTSFGVSLGMAFQIHDDILGLYGEDIGKDIGSDVREGKMTLLILKALEMCTPEEKLFLEKIMKQSSLSADELQNVQEIVERCGSLSYSQNLRDELIAKAKNTLTDTEFEDIGRDFLIKIADYIEERKL